MDKKKLIINKAIELFSKKGIQDTQIIEIANQLGMSKKTIYLEFQSKEKLVEASFNVVLQELDSILNGIVQNEAIFVEKLANYLKTIYAFIERFSESTIEELRKDFPKIARQIQDFINESIFYRFKKLLELGEAEGALRPGISIISSTLIYRDAITSYLTNRVKRELPEYSQHLLKKNQLLATNLVTIFRGLLHDPVVTVFDEAVSDLTLNQTAE